MRNSRKRSHSTSVAANCRANTYFLEYLIDGEKNDLNTNCDNATRFE